MTNVDGLRAAVSDGQRFSYLFFWGHRAPAPGMVGRWCLSQWWPAPFVLDGRRLATAEHFMMAEKARLFGDKDAEAAVLASTDPSEAKAIGRRVRGFNEEAWIDARQGIVAAGNEAKFRQHPALGSFLAGVREDVIVEASPDDAVWGIGLRETDRAARDPRKWLGINLLGFTLMAVRERLRT